MNKRILGLALPNIVTNITVPLLGMIDLAIVGHIGNQTHIGAIAIGVTIFNFIYWNFGFLRMGTSGFTAQAYGSRNFAEAMKALTRALSLALSIALILIVLQLPIAHFSFWVIDGSPQMKQLAYNYFRIRIWAAPATLCLYGIKGWFIGMQNARIPMYISLFMNVLNIFLSFLFVLVFHMDIEGVAWGTVLAQYGGLLTAAIYWLVYYRRFLRYFNLKQSLHWAEMLRFFQVNGDIFLRSLCLVSVFTFFPIAGAKMSDEILAINTLLLQFFMLFSYIIDGFAYAGESLTGRYIGANNNHRLKQSIRLLFRWGLALSLIFTIIYAWVGEKLLWFFTNDPAIISAAHPFYGWVLLVPLLGFAAFLWDGIFIGATASKPMRNTMFIATALFFLLYYAFFPLLKNNALWLALLAFLFARSLVQTVYAKRVIFGIKKERCK